MLISFFKPNQPIPNFIIPFAAGFLWLQAFLNPVVLNTPEPMPFYEFFSRFFSSLPGFLAVLIAVILISLQAIYLNYIFIRHEVLSKKTNIPLIIYILLVSLTPDFLTISPALFANTLLLLILNKVFQLYKNNNPLPLIFDIWTLLAITTLFYFPAILFAFLLWISLLILRPFVWREGIVGLFGFTVPYLFVSLYFFWTDRLEEFISVIRANRFNSFIFSGDPGAESIALFGILGFLFILSAFKVQASFYKNVIKTRGYQQVLFVMLFITILTFFYGSDFHLSYLSMAAIPLSAFLSYYFLSLKKAFWSEGLFILLLSAVLYAHFW
jgi:hypothetical protein